MTRLRRSRRAWTATVAFMLGAAALAPAADYPGAPPCDGTLQACIDGVAPGAVVSIVTPTPIDENVAVGKSLTLRAASGVAATIRGNLATRILSVTTPSDDAVDVTIDGLTFENARVSIDLYGGAGHRVIVRHCDVAHAVNSNNSRGIDVDVRAPASVRLARNRVATTGIPIALFSSLPPGSTADFTVVGNHLSASSPTLGYSGVSVDLRGAGSVRTDVFSNAVFGVTGCNCGGAAGIEVSTLDTVNATVSIVNNTIDDMLDGYGVSIRQPDPTSGLIVNLFNNLVTRTDDSGIRLPASLPQLIVNNGYNTFHANGGMLWNGYAIGAGTLDTDPQYVNAVGGDHHLQAISPAVDTGTDTPSGGLPEIDADGNLRVAGAQVDRGAYERGAASTTTTTTTSTSTTLPDVCPVGATYESVSCRLGGLAEDVEAGVESGRFQRKLVKLLAKARTKADAASASTAERRTRRLLKKAGKATARFVKRLGSRKGERTVDEAARATFTAAAEAIAADLAALESAPGATS